MSSSEALLALAAEWRVQADEWLRGSKAYKCRSMDGVRRGMVKAAAISRTHADAIEAIANAERTDEPPAPATA